MLATEVTFLDNGSAEIGGYWYYKEKNLPESSFERKQILAHWLNDRCCKTRLIGKAEQIEEILLSCEWDPSHAETLFRDIEGLISKAKKHREIPFEVERWEEPMDTAIPVNICVRLKRDMESVIAELHLGIGGIKLEIASEWNLSEEIQQFIRMKDN